MKKSLLAILVMAIALFSCLSPAYAHQKQKEHDNELLEVLFGEGYSLAYDKRTYFQAVADAAALCIDQFSTNDDKRSKESTFNGLRKRIGFSISFDNIELLNGKDGFRVSAKTHRKYTHRGWNFPYQIKSEQEFWKQRKKILTATINKEFFNVSSGFLGNFHFLEGSLYSESACNSQCEAFCVLIYNVHILGDYLEAESYSDEFKQLIPLVRHEDPQTPSMIDELICYIPQLFPNQKYKCLILLDKLEEIKQEAEDIVNVWGGIQTQEQFENYRRCAEQVYEALREDIPDMLRNESFFSDVFFK